MSEPEKETAAEVLAAANVPVERNAPEVSHAPSTGANAPTLAACLDLALDHMGKDRTDATAVDWIAAAALTDLRIRWKERFGSGLAELGGEQ